MVAPLHLGLEHPNVLWLVAAALAAFATGLGIRTWRIVERTQETRTRSASRTSSESSLRIDRLGPRLSGSR